MCGGCGGGGGRGEAQGNASIIWSNHATNINNTLQNKTLGILHGSYRARLQWHVGIRSANGIGICHRAMPQSLRHCNVAIFLSTKRILPRLFRLEGYSSWRGWFVFIYCNYLCTTLQSCAHICIVQIWFRRKQFTFCGLCLRFLAFAILHCDCVSLRVFYHGVCFGILSCECCLVLACSLLKCCFPVCAGGGGGGGRGWASAMSMRALLELFWSTWTVGNRFASGIVMFPGPSYVYM